MNKTCFELLIFVPDLRVLLAAWLADVCIVVAACSVITWAVHTPAQASLICMLICVGGTFVVYISVNGA